ncbi:MAG: hypothetical protein FWG47_02615 [Propionibacteriaceae bacterium]|nr:hypothetical protein [Propionibacteriaceae bacterium]
MSGETNPLNDTAPEFLPPDMPAPMSEPSSPYGTYGSGLTSPYAVPGAPVENGAAVYDAAAFGEQTGAAETQERVGRGLLFSLPGLLVGLVLSALLYRLGFIASITSFAMAYAMGWLYGKGAQAKPKNGVVPLICLIVVGLLLSLVAMLGTEIYFELAQEFPGAPVGDLLLATTEYIFLPSVWQMFLIPDALIFLAFGVIGTFSILMQLARSRSV